jgi:4-hydroxy-2-oxoheptanedioate aldolase
LGAWLNIASPHVAEIASRAGYEFIVIDLQHGMIAEAESRAMLQAIDAGGAKPVFRTPWKDVARLGKLLDMGADGLIVPMIDSVADTRAVVDACRYPPAGRRSYGPTRASMRRPDYFKTANATVAVFPMIETLGALEDAEKIAALDGVDGLFIGPADLSLSLGLPAARDNPDKAFVEAIDRVLAACKAHGKIAGIQADVGLGKRRIAQGFSFLTVAMDSSDLSAAFKSALAATRT